MKRRIDKAERKILCGLVKKGFAFIRTLSPEEVDLLSRLILGGIKLEVEDEEE